MSPVTIGLLGFAVLFSLLAIGMPISGALGLVGFVGMCLLYPFTGAIVKMATVPFEVIGNYQLAVLPLFLLMAQVTFASGFGADLFNLAAKLLGHRRGGLGMASIGGAAGFAACSGSSLATAATVGLVALPEMRKYGYDKKFAAGCVAAGGTIGSLVPPSGMFIIYGILTQQSIGKLFAASLIPAFLTIISYIVTIVLLCWRKPELGPPVPHVSWREKWLALKQCWELLLLLVIVIGGMVYGLFTATEAGGVGAFGSVVLAAARRRLSWKMLRTALMDTMRTAGMIYAIMMGAFIFNYFCAKTTLPEVCAMWITGLHVNRWWVLTVIIIIYFFLGMVMEAPSIQILTLPVFYPILITTLGFDPIWFGVIQVRMLEITLITPPLGMCAYIISGVDKDLSLTDVFRGSVPFLLMELVTMPLFMFVTPITMWLPSLMKV
ncbi:MAG TPA: TRAP transporter large permease [Syntrophorhabdaceae bacterium]|nr:TRAP transporter large permease [Syntrophorhabdaceae bacterium]